VNCCRGGGFIGGVALEGCGGGGVCRTGGVYLWRGGVLRKGGVLLGVAGLLGMPTLLLRGNVWLLLCTDAILFWGGVFAVGGGVPLEW